MKVLLTGATGVIGRPLVDRLVAAGHEVRAVSRRPEADAALRAAGAEPVAVDLFDPGAVLAAVAGQEAVLHLATHVPPLRDSAKRGAWDLHDRLRTEATRNLVAAARAAGVGRVVKESVTFLYAGGGDRWLTEDAPLRAELGRLAPTREGEELALGAASADTVAVVLRFGLFYGGPGNRGTDEALRLARWRGSTLAGRPSAFMSSIHVDDAASAVVASLGAPTGIYNAVDDEPLTRRAYLDAFSAALGTGRLLVTPGFVVRRMGGAGADALLASQRVSNHKLRAATAWEPRFRSAREGWRQVVAERGETVDA